MQRTLREIVRDAMIEGGLNIKQLARRTTELGDPVSEGTVHNVLKDRVSHARYATIRPLCHALGLDCNTVLAEIARPTRRTRSLSPDFHHLTDSQWRSLLVVARQLRIANEGRQRPTRDTENVGIHEPRPEGHSPDCTA